MDAVLSEPQGAHLHAIVIYLLPQLGIKKGTPGLWCSELGPHQSRWKIHLYIIYQVCYVRYVFRSIT